MKVSAAILEASNVYGSLYQISCSTRQLMRFYSKYSVVLLHILFNYLCIMYAHYTSKTRPPDVSQQLLCKSHTFSYISHCFFFLWVLICLVLPLTYALSPPCEVEHPPKASCLLWWPSCCAVRRQSPSVPLHGSLPALRRKAESYKLSES